MVRECLFVKRSEFVDSRYAGMTCRSRARRGERSHCEEIVLVSVHVVEKRERREDALQPSDKSRALIWTLNLPAAGSLSLGIPMRTLQPTRIDDQIAEVTRSPNIFALERYKLPDDDGY